MGYQVTNQVVTRYTNTRYTNTRYTNTRYTNTHWVLLSNIQKITMYTRQPFGPGGVGYRNFFCFVSELCPWPSIRSRAHFGGEGNQWASPTQWKGGEAPTQLNVIELLDHSNQSSGIISEESRLRLYEQSVIRNLHDLCLYSIISLLDRPQSPGAWN
jgi:hypothetical protein